MTIAAGFQCSNGVLVCADTEHSGYGLSYHEDKIFKVETELLKAVFSFTGNVALAHAAIYKCIQTLKVSKPKAVSSHNDIALIVEQVVNAEYKKHVSTHSDPNTDSAYQLLVAAWCSQSPGAALYETWHGTISPVDRYVCLGGGLYVGHYLLGPVFNQGMDLDSARILALYTVSAAKEHVEGVGGRTGMMSIGHDGKIVPNQWFDMKPFETAMNFYDANVRQLLFGLLSKEDQQFEGSLEFFGKLLRHIRKNLAIDDASQAEKRAAHERLINYLDALAKRSTQQSTTPDQSDPPPSPE